MLIINRDFKIKPCFSCKLSGIEKDEHITNDELEKGDKKIWLTY